VIQIVYQETAFSKIYHYEGMNETSPTGHSWTSFQADDYILGKQLNLGMIFLFLLPLC